MIENKLTPWLKIGYTIFAYKGLNELKIEVLSRLVNKSKSSFYHHFADMEIYLDYLLNFHIKQAFMISEEIKNKNLNTEDILTLIIEHKDDIFFHKQLRINRDKKIFYNCFQKAYFYISNAFMEYWTKEVGLTNNTQISKELLDLIEENFYLSITEQNFTYNRLLDYMTNIKELINNLKSYNH